MGSRSPAPSNDARSALPVACLCGRSSHQVIGACIAATALTARTHAHTHTRIHARTRLQRHAQYNGTRCFHGPYAAFSLYYTLSAVEYRTVPSRRQAQKRAGKRLALCRPSLELSESETHPPRNLNCAAHSLRDASCSASISIVQVGRLWPSTLAVAKGRAAVVYSTNRMPVRDARTASPTRLAAARCSTAAAVRTAIRSHPVMPSPSRRAGSLGVSPFFSLPWSSQSAARISEDGTKWRPAVPLATLRQ